MKRHFCYRQNEIRASSNYKRILTEFLLQRTRAESVSKIYQDFFQTFPSWKSINDAPFDIIENALRPIGLHKRRSVVLKELSQKMIQRKGRFPSARNEIEGLPGVGQYIANAIELFVHSRPLPLLDVNMARLLERYFGARKLVDIRYDPYLQDLSRNITCISDNPILVNWAILDFSAIVCRKKTPQCKKCCLSKGCDFFN